MSKRESDCRVAVLDITVALKNLFDSVVSAKANQNDKELSKYHLAFSGLERLAREIYVEYDDIIEGQLAELWDSFNKAYEKVFEAFPTKPNLEPM